MRRYIIQLVLWLFTAGIANAQDDVHQWVDSLYAEAEHLCYDEDEFVQSFEYIREILPVVERQDFTDEDRAAVFSLASHVYVRLGDFDQAIHYADATLAIDRASGSPEDLSSSLNTLAGIYLAAEQPEHALHFIQEAIEVERPLGHPDRLAIRLGMASEIYVHMGQGEEALPLAQEALDLELPLGNPEKIGVRQSQLAGAYYVLRRDAEAEATLDQSIANLRLSDNKNSLAITLNQLGAICYARQALQKAAACYRESAEICHLTGNVMVESKACQQLSVILETLDPDGALQNLKRYVELSQQLYNAQTSQTLARYEARYETAQKEHQLQLLGEELKLRRTWLIVLGLLLVAALVGMVLVRRITVLRMKRDQLLVKSNLMGITELGELPDIHFTRREKEVIVYCSQGLQAKEIADRMGISERTVSNHKNNIFRKLGIQNTVELVTYAHKAGILTSQTAE